MLKALVFDSVFDPYRGVVCHVRVASGSLPKGASLRFLGTGARCEALEVGFFSPARSATAALTEGEIGYVVTGLRSVRQARVGDTLALENAQAEPLPGFRVVAPRVFAGIFPMSADGYPALRDALEKLALTDAALHMSPESSGALGNGFRVGALGMLHLEIITGRLEGEYQVPVMVSVPSVPYTAVLSSGEQLDISSAEHLPDPASIAEIREMWVRVEVLCREQDVGGIMELVTKRRGTPTNMTYLENNRVNAEFDMPLAETIGDFHDRVKSVSSGYASFSAREIGQRAEKLLRMDILVAGDPIAPLALIVHRDKARGVALPILQRLKEIIPRQNFPIALQAATGGRILARETIPAYRKDVTAGLYGGDVSRKRKLLEKQKKGKARLKAMGKVELPQEAFFAVLRGGSE